MRTDSGDHTGSPLRNPRQSEKCFSIRYIRALDETSRFQATTRRQNTTFIAHFGRCQKFAFRSVLPSSHKSRAFAGALYLIRFRPRQSEKCFSIRYIRAQDETSRFRATTRRQNTTFIAHFGGCQKFAFRSVLPLSHKSRAFAGTLYLIRFRPRQSEKCFSIRYIRAQDETSRFRATTRRQNTTFIAHFGGCQKFAFRSVLPLSHKSRAFAGTLYLIRFRPRQSEKCFSIRYIRAQDETSRFRATTRRQNTTFIAHFGGCQKFAFRSVLPLSHKSRAFAGTLYLIRFRPRQSEKCFSIRYIRAQDETSRFRATTRRQNTTFIAHFGRCQKFAFRSVLPLSHKSRAFAGTLRPVQGSCKTPTQCVLWERGGVGAQSEGFSQENRANAPNTDDAALGKMLFHSYHPRIG